MQSYLDQLADIIANPTSNLVVAALLLAAVTVVVLIIILIALILLMPARRHHEDDDELAEKPRTKPERVRPARRPMPRKLQIGLFVGITLVTLATAYGVTSTNDYCANSCHVMAPSTAAWSEGAHDSVACIRCHEGTPVLSLPTATVSRIRQVGAELAGKAPVSAVVSSRTCLGCHERQLEGSIETSSGIRVSHAEPLEAGMSCDTCHVAVAHEREVASRSTIMTKCIMCHDGAKAAAECSTCHLGDPGASPVFDRIYTMTELPQPTCGGCHAEDSCDACHGIRMPHSQAFIDGDHARDAGFYRKEVCWNCHLKTDCGGCHGDFDSHGVDFVTTHRTANKDSTCTTCHKGHTGSFCDRCH